MRCSEMRGTFQTMPNRRDKPACDHQSMRHRGRRSRSSAAISFGEERGRPTSSRREAQLLFKKADSTSWSSVALKFVSTSGNNKYFSGTIPAHTFQANDVVQYYLRIAYDPHERQTTFLFGGDGISRKSGSEGAARGIPTNLPCVRRRHRRESSKHSMPARSKHGFTRKPG